MANTAAAAPLKGRNLLTVSERAVRKPPRNEEPADQPRPALATSELPANPENRYHPRQFGASEESRDMDER